MALQDISAGLNLPAQRTTGSTTEVDEFGLMIEMFNNVVREQVQHASISEGVFIRTSLMGTDTMSNAAFSDPVLQAVVPGVEPEGKTTLQGDSIVQVKTPIIARVTEGALSRVQDRLNIYGRMPTAFARLLAKQIDEIQMHKCVQSALSSDGAGQLSSLPGGKTQTEAVGGDALDPDKLESLFRALYTDKFKQEADPDTGIMYVTADVYSTLLNHDKLGSNIFVDASNSNLAMMQLKMTGGFMIKPTNRLPTAEITDNIMGTEYNVSAAEAKTLAVWASPEAIMSAEAIPITSDAYWDQRLLTWFVDSYMAFGTAIDNPAQAGVIMAL